MLFKVGTGEGIDLVLTKLAVSEEAVEERPEGKTMRIAFSAERYSSFSPPLVPFERCHQTHPMVVESSTTS